MVNARPILQTLLEFGGSPRASALHGRVFEHVSDGLRACARRWRVVAVVRGPAAQGAPPIEHARLVSEDHRRDLKTIAVATLLGARDWRSVGETMRAA